MPSYILPLPASPSCLSQTTLVYLQNLRVSSSNPTALVDLHIHLLLFSNRINRAPALHPPPVSAAAHRSPPPRKLTDANFKEATWDWVAEPAKAITAWGAIGDWDVSSVKDFSWAFSTNRNVVGGTEDTGGNPKAATLSFEGVGKWSTTAVTTLQGTFSGAAKYTAVGLEKWTVDKVTTFVNAFDGAAAMTPCSRRTIGDATSWSSNSNFAAYKSAWSAYGCIIMTDAQFKEASCK